MGKQCKLNCGRETNNKDGICVICKMDNNFREIDTEEMLVKKALSVPRSRVKKNRIREYMENK